MAIEDSLKQLNDPQNKMAIAETIAEYTKLIEEE